MPTFNRAKSLIIWWLIAAVGFGVGYKLLEATDRLNAPGAVVLLFQIPLGLIWLYSAVGLVGLPIIFVLAFGPSIWGMSNPSD